MIPPSVESNDGNSATLGNRARCPIWLPGVFAGREPHYIAIHGDGSRFAVPARHHGWVVI
jgi:hypothetical protein